MPVIMVIIKRTKPTAAHKAVDKRILTYCCMECEPALPLQKFLKNSQIQEAEVLHPATATRTDEASVACTLHGILAMRKAGLASFARTRGPFPKLNKEGIERLCPH